MKVFFSTLIFLTSLSASAAAGAADPFMNIACKGMTSELFKNARLDSLDTKKLEKTHKDLNLKFGTSYDKDEAFFAQTWSICDKTLLLIASPKARIVTDAALMKTPEPQQPFAVPAKKCWQNGREVANPVIAVLSKKPANTKKKVAVIQAWEVQHSSDLLKEIPNSEIECTK